MELNRRMIFLVIRKLKKEIGECPALPVRRWFTRDFFVPGGNFEMKRNVWSMFKPFRIVCTLMFYSCTDRHLEVVQFCSTQRGCWQPAIAGTQYTEYPKKRNNPLDIHWISQQFHVSKRWPMDIYKISFATWDEDSGSTPTPNKTKAGSTKFDKKVTWRNLRWH